MKLKALLATALFLAGLPAAAQAPAMAEDRVVAIKVLHGRTPYAVGKSHGFALRLTVKPGFHINAAHPADKDMIPTRLSFTAPAGVRVVKIEYPRPAKRKLKFMKKPSLVYDGGFVIRVRFSLAAGLKAKQVRLAGVLSFQACDDESCHIPDEAKVAVTLPLSGR